MIMYIYDNQQIYQQLFNTYVFSLSYFLPPAEGSDKGESETAEGPGPSQVSRSTTELGKQAPG